MPTQRSKSKRRTDLSPQINYFATKFDEPSRNLTEALRRIQNDYLQDDAPAEATVASDPNFFVAPPPPRRRFYMQFNLNQDITAAVSDFSDHGELTIAPSEVAFPIELFLNVKYPGVADLIVDVLFWDGSAWVSLSTSVKPTVLAGDTQISPSPFTAFDPFTSYYFDRGRLFTVDILQANGVVDTTPVLTLVFEVRNRR